jgi:hypothetical protein
MAEVRDPNRRGVVRWKPKVQGRTFAPADIVERQAETDVYGAPIGSMGGAIGGERDKYITQNMYQFTDPFVGADLGYRTTYGVRSGALNQGGPSETQQMLNAILAMGRGGGTADSNAGKWQAELAFERQKYADEQAAAARQRQALQDYVSSGAFRAGSDQLMNMIQEMGTRQRGDVEGAYNRALENIGAGFTQAEQLTGQGFGALRDYLARNPNDPYAQLVAAAGVTPTAEGQNILSAYGVGAEPVLAQAAAEAEASRQGAAGFQNLIDTLSAASQQAGTSRMSEAEMAATLAGANLQSQRAGYRTQAESAQAAALAQIAQRIAEQEYAERQRQIALEEELRRRLAEAGVGQPTATRPGGLPELGRGVIDIPLSGQFGLVD